MNLMRYKIQQDKGKYCLKGCDDGDLVDYSAYAALEARCRDFEPIVRTVASLDLGPKGYCSGELSVLREAARSALETGGGK